MTAKSYLDQGSFSPLRESWQIITLSHGPPTNSSTSFQSLSWAKFIFHKANKNHHIYSALNFQAPVPQGLLVSPSSLLSFLLVIIRAVSHPSAISPPVPPSKTSFLHSSSLSFSLPLFIPFICMNIFKYLLLKNQGKRRHILTHSFQHSHPFFFHVLKRQNFLTKVTTFTSTSSPPVYTPSLSTI